MFKSVLLIALLGFVGLRAEDTLVFDDYNPVVPDDDVPSNLPLGMVPPSEIVIPEYEGMGEDEVANEDTIIISDDPSVPYEVDFNIMPDNGPLAMLPIDDTVFEFVPNNLPLEIDPEFNNIVHPEIPEEDVPNNLPYPMEPPSSGGDTLTLPDVPGVPEQEVEPPSSGGDTLTLPDVPGVPEQEVAPEEIDDTVIQFENDNLPLFIDPDAVEFGSDGPADYDEVPNNLPYPMEPQSSMPEEDVPNNLPYPMEPLVL
ncbi:hypothetical protein QE152_g13570 [Popillia japonica]|uniref:Uncharacterized protein n=1 Tax=Popillia japonica TaxID=7064 RepID=A0AAW1LD11_POPJA